MPSCLMRKTGGHIYREGSTCFSNTVNIAVGYAWHSDSVVDVGLHRDLRWQSLRSFCKAAGNEAIARWPKLAAAALIIDNEPEKLSRAQQAKLIHLDGSKVQVSVRRLRAAAGSFIWADISQRIRDADILVFDLSARYVTGVKSKRTKTDAAANVILELGYALAFPCKPLFMVADDIGMNNLKDLLPSDLRGVLVGRIPTTRKFKVMDRSLRNALVSSILDCLKDKHLKAT